MCFAANRCSNLEGAVQFTLFVGALRQLSSSFVLMLRFTFHYLKFDRTNVHACQPQTVRRPEISTSLMSQTDAEH